MFSTIPLGTIIFSFFTPIMLAMGYVGAMNGTLDRLLIVSFVSGMALFGFIGAYKFSGSSDKHIRNVSRNRYARKLEDDIAFCLALGDYAYYDEEVIRQSAEEMDIKLNDARIDSLMFKYLSNENISFYDGIEGNIHYYREIANQIYH
jgi:hypothetical protein